MSFAGGPWNNYTMHGIAAMADVLRADRGSLGLCTANGGYLTKHSFGVYSTKAPEHGSFQWRSTQDEVDALPARGYEHEPDGAVTIESYTVMHDRDGEPELGLAAVLLPDGRRAWGTTTDPATMVAMTKEDPIGHPARINPDGALTI